MSGARFDGDSPRAQRVPTAYAARPHRVRRRARRLVCVHVDGDVEQPDRPVRLVSALEYLRLEWYPLITLEYTPWYSRVRGVLDDPLRTLEYPCVL